MLHVHVHVHVYTHIHVYVHVSVFIHAHFHVQDHYCSLSLWRVVRGSKLMHLDLIHGLFIT
jgi:hypothetical protein